LCHLQLADKGICFSSDGINNKQSWKFSLYIRMIIMKIQLFKIQNVKHDTMWQILKCETWYHVADLKMCIACQFKFNFK
jgi:hypothetical protein